MSILINPFVLKRLAATLLSGFIPAIMFFIGLTYYGFIYALFLLFLGLSLCVLLSGALLANPFSVMLEGGGILTIDMTSTGILRLYTSKVQEPYIKGKVGGTNITDIFDRAAIFQLTVPTKTQEPAKLMRDRPEGGITIDLTEEDFNRSRFALYHYPVIISNSILKTLVTKDFLSEFEKTSFTEHGLLYLNRKMEELTSITRDFSRYVVEMLKPKGEPFWTSKWFWIIMIAMLIALLLLFGPQLMQAVGLAKPGVSSAVNAIGQTGTIVPQ